MKEMIKSINRLVFGVNAEIWNEVEEQNRENAIEKLGLAR